MRKIFKSSMKKGKYYTADGIKEVFDPYYEKFCSVEFLSKEEQYLLNKQKEIAMSTNYIDRSHDEEIIDIVRSVMNNGTGKAETVNEHILIKLMQLRGTAMDRFEFDQEKVDSYYEQWKLLKNKVDKLFTKKEEVILYNNNAMILGKEHRDKFLKVVIPVIKFLAKEFPPTVKVIVDDESAELVDRSLRVVNTSFLRD